MIADLYDGFMTWPLACGPAPVNARARDKSPSARGGVLATVEVVFAGAAERRFRNPRKAAKTAVEKVESVPRAIPDGPRVW